MLPSTIKLIDAIALSQQQCAHPIACKLAYATTENFLGRVVEGYHSDAMHICLATPKTAHALCQVQQVLNKKGLGLFVFDCYRPLRAVRDFKYFMHAPVVSDYEIERKKLHYPSIEKSQFAKLRYVADEVSNHCFGDTVDLSLIDLQTNQLLDMGAPFDYFDVISHPTATVEQIGELAYQNRKLLSDVMQDAGFAPYEKEFWHFTFSERENPEPIDVAISRELEGYGVKY